MPKAKKKSKALFKIQEVGRASDGKSALYRGHVGGTDIGTVAAKTKTIARAKLLRLARAQLK